MCVRLPLSTLFPYTTLFRSNETVDYLLFAGETTIASPVVSGSAFAKSFASAGPRDRKGRSLRELDLRTRVFRYRCSYMIYSPRSEEHTSELQSLRHLVCRLL